MIGRVSLTIVGKIFPLIRLKVVRKVLAAAIARILGKNLGRVGQELGDEGSAFLGGGVGGKSGDRHHGASKAKLVAVCVSVPEGKVATQIDSTLLLFPGDASFTRKPSAFISEMSQG